MTDTFTPASLAPSAAEKFRTRVLPFLAMAAILALIPALGPSRSLLTLFNAIGINIVFALSYNMLLGRAGLLSFGHAVYFGLGGYAAMHVMQAVDDGNGLWAHFPMVALPLVGFAGGLLAAAVIGWPSCKRAGIPFAMISLGIAELIASAGFMFVSLFGGEEGISGDRTYGPLLFGFDLGPIGNVYWFIAFWTLLATVAMFAFTRTPLGKIGEAVRDNPQRVEFVGYDPQRVRYLIFMAAGGFAGLAGGMAAVTYEIFTPESLSLLPSGFVLLMAYVGGIRFFAGPILGAVALTYMQSNLSDFSAAWQLYLGLLFVSIVLFAPAGLAGIFGAIWTGMRSPGAGARLLGWLKVTVAALLAAAGLVIVIEVVTRITDGYGEVFTPFGQPLPPDSALTWGLAAVLLVAGLGLLRLWLPGKREGRR
ncbi:branched-chain amino acid ABC transporter permease [Acidimangrovimonas pyrenivorans]|uniref:Branched-chain amino acid ABC transporter permease n=1 Tax=Acidimangrovimonas pyrenivorans TaxID=2030798 RepID=A0ABV7AD62_9RHOB